MNHPLNPNTENSAGSPTIRPSKDQPSECERFAALTDKLVKVPKKELDEKRKAES